MTVSEQHATDVVHEQDTPAPIEHPDTPDRIDALLDAVPQAADHVLDIGCVRHDAQKRDRGNLHAHLASHVDGHVTGIDVVEDEVRAMQAAGYDARVADAQDFQLDGEFDVVVAGDIIEHLGDPKGMLESARRHLSPDGRLVVTTPNAWCWFFVAQTIRGHVHCNSEHKHWYDARTLRQALESSGFDAEVGHVVGVPDSVPQRWLQAAFRAVGRLPLSEMQRAPVLLATASPMLTDE